MYCGIRSEHEVLLFVRVEIRNVVEKRIFSETQNFSWVKYVVKKQEEGVSKDALWNSQIFVETCDQQKYMVKHF